MAIEYSKIELAKIKEIESQLQTVNSPASLNGFVRKSYFGKGSADLEVKLDAREFIAKITTNMRDRDNEIVRTEGIDLRQYNKNKVILWAHNYIEPAIGRAEWIKRFTDPKDRKSFLLAKGVMAHGTSRSEEVLTLMQQGVLNTISIGFIPIAGHAPTEDEIKEDAKLKGVWYIHDKVMLLEFSVVNVPANPEATIEAVGKGDIKMSVEMQKQLKLYVEPNTPAPSGKKAIPYFQTPIDGVEAGWSLSEEIREANIEQLSVMAAWVDGDNKESTKAYKLVHHRKTESHPLVFEGLAEAMSKLNLFTIKIPVENRVDVYKHLAKHYRDDFGKEPPELVTEPKQYDIAEISAAKIETKKIFKVQPIPKPAVLKTTDIKVIETTTLIDPEKVAEDVKDKIDRDYYGKV